MSPRVTLLLLSLGLVSMQCLIGGARMAYALPGYLCVALAGVSAFTFRKATLVQPNPWCLGTAFTLAGYVMARSLLSPVPALARVDFFLALGGLVVYLVCALYLSGTTERFEITLILVLMGVAHLAVGIFQFKDQANFMALPWIFRPDYSFRASGFYIAPNHLATLLGMLAVLTLSICCWSRVALGTRAFAFYGFIVALTGIALTGSRIGYYSTGAGVALFAALSAWLARRFNRPNFFGVAMATALLLTGVVAVSLLFVVRSEIYEKRLRHVRDPSRLAEQLAPAAWQQHQLEPTFGTGSGTFYYYGRQFHGPGVQNDPQHVHNEYLELLAEYGWVGAALFAAFLLSHLAVAVSALFRVLSLKLQPTALTASNELATVVGSLCALGIGLAQATHDFPFHLPGNALVAAFLFAMLANPTVETASRRQRRPLPPWLGVAVPVLALLLLGAGLRLLLPSVTAERARTALRDNDYQAALDLSHRATTGDPVNADAHYLEGEAARYLALEAADPARALELRHQAATSFETGLKHFPQDVRLLLKLGQVRDDLGDFTAGSDCFDRALAAEPNSGIAHAATGLHWHRQRQYGRARESYLAAQKLGEAFYSTAGLKDLERDEALARSNDAFADLLPDSPEPAHVQTRSSVLQP
jgi:O-antigen ligase